MHCSTRPAAADDSGPEVWWDSRVAAADRLAAATQSVQAATSDECTLHELMSSSAAAAARQLLQRLVAR